MRIIIRIIIIREKFFSSGTSFDRVAITKLLRPPYNEANNGKSSGAFSFRSPSKAGIVEIHYSSCGKARRSAAIATLKRLGCGDFLPLFHDPRMEVF
jgi:hypothetical protein